MGSWCVWASWFLLGSYVDNGVVWSMGPMGFEECTLMRNLGLVVFFAVAIRVFWLDFLRNVKSTVISAETLFVFDSRSPSVSSTTAVMPTKRRASGSRESNKRPKTATSLATKGIYDNLKESADEEINVKVVDSMNCFDRAVAAFHGAEMTRSQWTRRSGVTRAPCTKRTQILELASLCPSHQKSCVQSL